jgi:hypothetical protein
MSKIALVGNASGTGTFSLASPNSSTDRTLTLPDETGTVLTSASSITQNAGPAFIYYTTAAGQTSFANSTATKVIYDGKIKDTDNCVSSSRFTPTVEGYYQICASTRSENSITNASLFRLGIYKNGSVQQFAGAYAAANNGYVYPNASALVYLNGSTDYVEIYLFQNTGSTINNDYGGSAADPAYTFTGFLARAA